LVAKHFMKQVDRRPQRLCESATIVAGPQMGVNQIVVAVARRERPSCERLENMITVE
jgi:hypothetical protein